MFAIIRDGKEIELTKRELAEAAEHYEYIIAEEILVERVNTAFGAENVTERMVDAAVEKYLDYKNCGCDEDYCIDAGIEDAKEISLKK